MVTDSFEREVAPHSTTDAAQAIRRFVIRKAVQAGSITADDIHKAHAIMPFDVKDTRSFGAVLGALAREGVLKAVGYENSTRETCHHRPIRRFEPTPLAREERDRMLGRAA